MRPSTATCGATASAVGDHSRLGALSPEFNKWQLRLVGIINAT
jgi:hypothetical protein